jgi:SAM-dependent methyltransferase
MGDMIDIICALCGKKQQVKTLYPATFKEKELSEKTYSARRFPDKIHYRILKCEKCSLIFSSPILPARKSSMFYKESLCNYNDQIPYLIKTYFEIIKKIKKHLPESPKVLEVGCGSGFFLKAIKDFGFTKKVFGVEPSKNMVFQADPSLKNKIKVDFFKSGLFSKESFDLILCFHTLDHVANPNDFVKEAFSILKKGGYIIVIVHDTEGLSAKLFGERSAIFDIEHVYLFNKKTLNLLFSRNKFEVVKIFNVVNVYPLSYWIKMSGFSLAVKKIASYFINILKLNKISLPIPAGNIGLIAKKS